MSFYPYLTVVTCCLLLLSACEPGIKKQTHSNHNKVEQSVESSVTAKSAFPQTWQYIQVDNKKQMWGEWNEPEWLRYFGLAAGDINADALPDIVSGRYVYLQNKDSLGSNSSNWQRLDLGANVDAILVLDIDGDDKLDIIAQSLPDLFWYELSSNANEFTRVKIGQVPATSHVNSQGFTLANIVGDARKEFIIAGNGNLYAFSAILQSDGTVTWQQQRIAENTSDEGIGAGDIDGDGDIDIAAGRRPEGESEPKEVMWFENPGHIDGPWQAHYVGEGSHPIDRVEIADLNNDGKGDIVFTEERYPGLEPDAEMVLFLQSEQQQWQRQVLVTQYSMNNLDIDDVDQDGDLDIVTAEHKGETLETQLWLNDGSASFTKNTIDTGKENHLGTQLVDIDNDGDMDIIGAGWDQHQFVHLWLNPLRSNIEFSELTYLGREHIKVTSPSASYLLDKKGGGFSAIIDSQGKDWVNFKMQPWGDYPDAAAGAFRGLPNLVHGQGDESGAGHPGFDKMRSEQVGENSIVSTSLSGDWQWRYDFYPEGVKMRVLAAPAANYWFLYEGTPGGEYNLAQTRYGTNSLGWQADTPDFYNGSIKQGQYQWAYFSHLQSAQSFYVLQLSDGDTPDTLSYLGNSDKGVNSSDGMVVFGFGRDAQGQALLSAQHAFFFGFAPYVAAQNEDHALISNYINRITEQFKLESQHVL